jgi:thiol-disulfide isomerase/thioredoxin
MKVFYALILLSLFTLHGRSSFAGKMQKKIQVGEWKGTLNVKNQNDLSFLFRVEKKKGSFIFVVQNGKERIELVQKPSSMDSLVLSFPVFDSELRLAVQDNKHLSGFWYNYHKGKDYKIPCSLSYSFDKRNQSIKNIPFAVLKGKWEVDFSPEDPYKALGVFEQNEHSISGTFLTETGDYRFLSGTISGGDFELSCFDGSHAFLFKGTIEKEKIKGLFISGVHYATEWSAQRNAHFELTHPDSLTRLNTTFRSFETTDLLGNALVFDSTYFQGRVTIIQILGTWCPNCMDESLFLKELYQENAQQGLSILGICYETGDGFDEYRERISHYKERMQIPYPLYVGGKASKQLASQQFPDLTSILSFPTMIIVGKDGKVKKIHTGFYGPGTGLYYEEFTKDTKAFIETLCNEP